MCWGDSKSKASGNAITRDCLTLPRPRQLWRSGQLVKEGEQPGQGKVIVLRYQQVGIKSLDKDGILTFRIPLESTKWLDQYQECEQKLGVIICFYHKNQ